MNRKLAAALALAFAAPSAFAITLPTTATDVLYVAGATAVDRTLFESMVDPTNGICETGFIGTTESSASVVGDYDATVIPEVYTDQASFDPTAPKNWAVYCKVKTGYSVSNLVGVTVGINKFSGASETGIDPLGGQVPYAVSGTTTVSTQFVDPTSACGSTSTFVPTVTTTGADRVAYKVHTGCTLSPAETSTANTGLGIIPNVGISDVDANLFNASVAVKNNLNQAGALTTTFAPLVSKPFFEALQTAQGITGCTNTVAGHTAACMPSLSMAQLRGLFTGKISSVAAFFDGTTAFATPTTSPNGGYTLSTFRICRRGNTSGTQKSFERNLTNQGCNKTTPNVLFATNATGAAAGGTWAAGTTTVKATLVSSASPQVFNGKSGSDVISCLNDATTYGQYALGVSSADQLPVDGTKEFRYIKIAGVAPTTDNVVSGDWTFTTENVVTDAVSPALAGNRPDLLTLVKTQLTVPAVLAKTHITIAGARFGHTVRPQLTLAPAASDSSSVRPVAPFIRAATNGATVNNCNDLQSTTLIKN